MRVERNPGISPVLHHWQSLPPLRRSQSSIQCMNSAPSYVWNLFIFAKRGVWNFFRAILSYVFPIQPRERVKPAEITLAKVNREGEELSYQIRLNGFTTKNEMIFRKEDNKLVFLEIKFPNSEMREHIRVILDRVMRDGKVESIFVKDLATAEILWRCGFRTTDKIRHNTEGQDPINLEIARVIRKAKEKENTLNNHYL